MTAVQCLAWKCTRLPRVMDRGLERGVGAWRRQYRQNTCLSAHKRVVRVESLHGSLLMKTLVTCNSKYTYQLKPIDTPASIWPSWIIASITAFPGYLSKKKKNAALCWKAYEACSKSYLNVTNVTSLSPIFSPRSLKLQHLKLLLRHHLSHLFLRTQLCMREYIIGSTVK